jgi:hypothetical protein
VDRHFSIRRPTQFDGVESLDSLIPCAVGSKLKCPLFVAHDMSGFLS